MLMTLLLLVVPLTALGLVLGMARLEENLFQVPTAAPEAPDAPAPAHGALR